MVKKASGKRVLKCVMNFRVWVYTKVQKFPNMQWIKITSNLFLPELWSMKSIKSGININSQVSIFG